MKIVSWNVFNLNRRLDRMLGFIAAVDADVLALQEVAAEHVRALGSLPGYGLFTAEDFVEDGALSLLAILTRLPAGDRRVVAHNRGRALSASPLGRRMAWRECLESLSVEVTPPGGGRPVRVVTLHLSCAVSPRARLHELEQVRAHLDPDGPAALCGDFNTFATPWLNPFVGWLYGFSWRDLPARDIVTLDGFCAANGFVRLAHEAPTFPRYRLHLDHLLLRGLRADRHHVERDTHGSDHRPIVAVVELAA